MKKFLSNIFASLLCLTLAISPAGSAGILLLAKAAAVTYSGPGDVAGSTAKFWWGLRAYSAAKAGTKAIKLCDHLGANCTDVLTSVSTGALVAPTAIGADNCTSITTCVIDTFYDQAGVLCTSSVACDVQQTTNANRASFNWNSGTPFAVFDGASSVYSTPASLISAVTQTFTISVVTNVTTPPAGLQQLISALNGNGGDTIGFTNNFTQSFWMYAGNNLPVVATTANVWQSVQALFNDASSSFEINGSTTIVPSTPGTQQFDAGQIALGASAFNSTRFYGGNFREGGLWAGTPTDMTTNQRTFWGF